MQSHIVGKRHIFVILHDSVLALYNVRAVYRSGNIGRTLARNCSKMMRIHVSSEEKGETTVTHLDVPVQGREVHSPTRMNVESLTPYLL
jgi:hypothetical protein